MDKKKLWQELSKILGFTPKLDGLITAASGKITIDIIALDYQMGDRISEYDPNNATYKGKPDYSMNDVIYIEYGQEAVEIIKQLI